jgi:hypothetical protein
MDAISGSSVETIILANAPELSAARIGHIIIGKPLKLLIFLAGIL